MSYTWYIRVRRPGVKRDMFRANAVFQVFVRSVRIKQGLNRLFINSFIHSFIHSFIRSLVRSFVRLFVRSFIHSFIHAFIHSFIYSFIFSFFVSSILTTNTVANLEHRIGGFNGTNTPTLMNQRMLSLG